MRVAVQFQVWLLSREAAYPIAAMSDAAMKVDPEYYNKRLLETNSQRAAAAPGHFPAAAPPSDTPSWSGDGRGGGGGGGAGSGVNVGGALGGGGLPDLPDYLVRQHSLLGLYLSLNPGDEGTISFLCAYNSVGRK